MSVGEGEGGERREGIEAGGGGDGYCGYRGYCRYRYRFVTDHKIVIRTHTHRGLPVPVQFPSCIVLRSHKVHL